METTLSQDQNLRRVGVEVLYAMGGSLFLSLCAQISVHLPFTPVAFTMHVFGVLMLAATLGARRSMYAIVTYLAQAAMGLPVCGLGIGGLHHLLGPAGGFFLAFVPAAGAVGFSLQHPKCQNNWQRFGVLMLGSAIILAGGWAWLCVWVGPAAAWGFGVAPFVAFDVVKSLMALAALPCARKVAAWL